MKKGLLTVLLAMSMIAALVGCGNSEEVIEEDYIEVEDSEDIAEEEYTEYETEGEYLESYSLTLFAAGGSIYFDAEEPYDVELGAYTLETGKTLGEAIDNEILSVEKDGAAFLGWQVYTSGSHEMSEEEVTTLEEGQLCISVGDYGYVLLSDTEEYEELLSTEDMRKIPCDEKDYWVIAEWE